jgi:hypothetical protein
MTPVGGWELNLDAAANELDVVGITITVKKFPKNILQISEYLVN